MATATMNYAAFADVTITLTSLASGSSGWQQSAVVDNTTNKYLDCLVGGSIQVGTTGLTAGQTITFYAYGARDTSQYTGGASGTNIAYTADGEEGLFKLLDVIIVDATTNENYEWGPVSVAEAFGGTLPSKWGVVCHNNSGATTHATGTNNEVRYQGIKYDF